MKHMACAAIGTCIVGAAGAQTNWLPSDPGAARLVNRPDYTALINKGIEARFTAATGGLRFFGFRNAWDVQHHAVLSDAFSLKYRDGHTVTATQLKLQGNITPDNEPGGKAIAATLVDPATGVTVKWRVVLHDHAHYIREFITLSTPTRDADIASVGLGEGGDKGVVMGNCPGSPLMTSSLFIGIEHPMSVSSVNPRLGWSVHIDRKLALRKGQSVTYSAVFGVAPEGQERRAFLAYLEKERPRPYKPFLHYNSWYDIGYFGRYKETECVDRINTFGQELAVNRKVHLSSFLFDDGWDDTSTLWQFHKDFPNGFTPLKQAAEKYGADPGIWLSPWGGYGDPRGQRLKAGKAAGMEIDSQGYALSGPKYYDLFHNVCMDLVKKYGINQFKFDGTGSPDKYYPGSAFTSDFEAAIQLIHDLRAAKPGLFINLTTGTWPSPFWTQYADSIWRGGSDHSFAGVGSWRQKWITYRDGDTFHGIVERGPLYPLNSLMLHGLIYAKQAFHLNTDPDGDFRSEIHDYFGTGTQLQEMYITPSLLTKQNWDELAEAANWSYANRDVLADTHWVGGDPNNLEVYGWASWSPRKAILTLRNPSDKPQAFAIDPHLLFELPNGVHGTWVAKSPFKGATNQLSIPIKAVKPDNDEKPKEEDPETDATTGSRAPASGATIVLKPFEVLTFEGEIK